MSSNSARSIPPAASWDATKTAVPAQLLQESFQLASFLFPDRSTAIEIVVRALARLRSRSHREMKRLYWRDKHSTHPVRRVARSDADMLQWLIMFESEQLERVEEQAGVSSPDQMVVRYIKYLVQFTTTLSSFHVNVGVTRLLYNYSTAEAQAIYELLTSRFLGPDTYRRAKAVLMDRLGQRFDGFLKTTRTEHGEIRFETADDQTRWSALVDRCLTIFTPWSTHGLCSRVSTIVAENQMSSSLHRSTNGDLNDLEMRCCHLLIDPSCYQRLLHELRLESPATKLALPRFFMSEKYGGSNNNGNPETPVTGLSGEEMDRIQKRLAASESRRRKMDPPFVTVVVDGHELGRLDLRRQERFVCDLEAGAAFIEIRTKDGLDDVTLATHFISYVDEAFEFSRSRSALGHGRIEFTVTPSGDVQSYPSRGSATLTYRPAFGLGEILARWVPSGSRRRVRSYALTVVAVALIGWGAAGVFYRHQNKLLQQQLEQAQRNQQQLAPTIARAVISYMLVRDDQIVRGAGTARIPEISLRRYPPAVSLELPLNENAAPDGYKVELRTFAGDQILMTESNARATSTDAGPAVEIVFSAMLLQPDTYYTVFLYSGDRTDRFTFKAVATE